MYAIASADLNKYNIEVMKALNNPRSFNITSMVTN